MTMYIPTGSRNLQQQGIIQYVGLDSTTQGPIFQYEVAISCFGTGGCHGAEMDRRVPVQVLLHNLAQAGRPCADKPFHMLHLPGSVES